MSDSTPIGFGPRGRYRFPSAVNVAFARKGDKWELAIALDDGGRAIRMAYSILPQGKRAELELSEVAFPGGGSGRAASLAIPASCRGLQLDFLDRSGLRLADLACLLDTREGTLSVPPFTGEGYSLSGPLEFGPAGKGARARAVTLFSAKGSGLHITGRFLLDDGGQSLFVVTSGPGNAPTHRELVPRATPSAPASLELTFAAEPAAAFVDFLDRKGQPIRELSLTIDFRTGGLRAQSTQDGSTVHRNAVAGLPPEPLGVLCRVCRNEKPLADCRETDLLPKSEKALVERDSLPTWDLGFVCSSCFTRILEAERERQQLSRLATYWVTAASSIGLFLQAYLGVLQLLLPHGPVLHDMLGQTFPILASRPGFLLGLSSVLWGLLFTTIPFSGIWQAYTRVFLNLPMYSGVLAIASLAFQGVVFYSGFRYLSLAKVPPFVPVGPEQNPLLWLNFYLYAVVAALVHVLIAEFFGQSLRSLSDSLVTRGPGVAARVNRIFRRFQKLVGLREEGEIHKTLKEILQEDMGVREYHLLASDENRQAFLPTVSEGRALAEIASVRVARGDANFLGHAAMFGEIYGSHSLKNPDLKRVLSKGPLPCAVCVPVKVDGEVRALLNIASFQKEAYDSDDLAHLSTLSSLLGIALTNAREYRRKDEQLAYSQAILEKEVSAKEELRSAFAKYVPPALIDRIMEDPENYLNAEPERATLTVLFTDLKGFSSLSEKVGNPSELARILNLYLTAMTDIVFRHWGTLDKYVGDAVIAFFGWPVNYYQDHARRACIAALEMRDRMIDLAEEIGHPDLAMRIGINTGEMVVGNFGSAVRKSLTVLGDNVNLGARLEPTNKEYGTDVLVTGETHAQTGDLFWMREVDQVRVVGRKTPVVLFEPLALKTAELPEEIHGLLAAYAEGLGHYRTREFESAWAAFSKGLALVPEDGPSKVMLDRTAAYLQTPPPPDWDGIYSVKVK